METQKSSVCKRNYCCALDEVAAQTLQTRYCAALRPSHRLADPLLRVGDETLPGLGHVKVHHCVDAKVHPLPCARNGSDLPQNVKRRTVFSHMRFREERLSELIGSLLDFLCNRLLNSWEKHFDGTAHEFVDGVDVKLYFDW